MFLHLSSNIGFTVKLELYILIYNAEPPLIFKMQVQSKHGIKNVVQTELQIKYKPQGHSLIRYSHHTPNILPDTQKSPTHRVQTIIKQNPTFLTPQ